MRALPNPPPADPLPLAADWLADAARSVPTNPWAMALATVGASGHPSVRYVLLKQLSTSEGFLVFFTNYASRKAAELESSGFAAGAMYWPDSGRQLRFEGSVMRSPDAESDSYFASRPRASQLNAWASDQSRPLDSAAQLPEQLARREAEFAETAVPRPAGWGGYRLLIDSIEFWLEGDHRFHDRLRFERDTRNGWSSTWLQP